MFSNFTERELALSRSGSWMGEMGSFASNLGFTSRQFQNASSPSTVFANRIIGASRQAGQNAENWAFNVNRYSDKANPVFKRFATLEQGLAAQGSATTGFKGGWNKFRFGSGAVGVSGVASFNLGLSAVFGVMDARRAGREGAGFGGQAAAFGSRVVKDLAIQRAVIIGLSNPALAVGAAVTVGGAAFVTKQTLKGAEQGNQYLRHARQSELNPGRSPSTMSRPAATMRQRSLQSMEFSKFNAMKALGNEASFQHMPKSGYSANPMYGY